MNVNALSDLFGHAKSRVMGAYIALGAMIGLSLFLVLTHTNVSAWRLNDGQIVAIYALLFVPWLALLVCWGNLKSISTECSWKALIATAVVIRVVFLWIEPVLSDDIFRYVWDGRVAAHGINPFVYPPAAEALRGVRDAQIWPNINHPTIPTIYPPVAQLFFELNAHLGGGTRLMRALLLLVEAAGIVGVWQILARTGIKPSTPRLKQAFCVYALCPLVFIEVAWSGHIDVLAWAPLIVALLLWVRATSKKMLFGGAVLFGISIAAKFLGVLAVPLILFGPRSKHEPTLGVAMRRRALFLCTAAIVVFASYVPYLSAGPKVLGALGTYASTWQSNAGVFRAISVLSESTLKAWAPIDSARFTQLTDASGAKKLIIRFPQYNEMVMQLGWTRMWRGKKVPATSFSARQIAQTLAKFLALFAVALAILWAIFVNRELIKGFLTVLLTLFLVAPVVHPWYVAWLLPFAAIRRSRPALVFSAAATAAYLAWINARNGLAWQVPDWVLCVEFGAVGFVAWFYAGKALDEPTCQSMPTQKTWIASGKSDRD